MQNNPKVYMNFYTWLHESTDRWNSDAPTRATIIRRLFLNVLKPMLHDAGYTFCYNDSEMLNKFSSWLHVIEREFYYDNQHTLIVPRALHRDEQIDRDNWALAFDDEIWYQMSCNVQWRSLLRSETALTYFWSVLPLVLYRYIDVVNSKRCKDYDAAEAEFLQLEYEWMVEQGLIVEKKKGDEFVDKPMGKYYD